MSFDAWFGRVSHPALLATLDRWSVGRLTVVFPDGTTRSFGTPDASPHATIRVHRDAFFRRFMLQGDLGAGELYMDGDWSCDDLPLFVKLVLLNRRYLPLETRLSKVLNLGNDLWHRLRVNTRAGSRRNIRYHYDLSNDFFALFLDETMTYSSAVFAHAGQPLAEAQRQKFRRLAEKALIGPEDHVLEIGCGWGGFATFAGLTLRRWREAFLANLDAARALGFDERFIRMWDYYLCVCEAAFETRTLGNLQIVLSRDLNAALPGIPAAFRLTRSSRP